jgi:hypothetical protein
MRVFGWILTNMKISNLMGHRTRARCNTIDNDWQAVFQKEEKEDRKNQGTRKVEGEGTKRGKVQLPFVAF